MRCLLVLHPLKVLLRQLILVLIYIDTLNYLHEGDSKIDDVVIVGKHAHVCAIALIDA